MSEHETIKVADSTAMFECWVVPTASASAGKPPAVSDEVRKILKALADETIKDLKKVRERDAASARHWFHVSV